MIVAWAQLSYEHLAKDEYLGSTAIANGPPQIEVRKNHFEMLIRSVVGQQLSGTAARAIYQKFKNTVGEVAAKNILNHDEQVLRGAGLSGAKASTIHGICRAALDGLDFRKITRLSDEEIAERLTKIKGIGPWTVEMFLIFSLGRPDVFSPGDLGLRKGLKVVYQLEELPTPKEAEELARLWSPYRSAASWYLWRVIE